MKKHLFMLTIMVLTLMCTVKAQLQKGYVLIGGDIMDLDLGLNSGNSFVARLNPKAAWFIQNNVAIGGFLDLGLSTAKGAGTTVNYGVGGLFRYYFNTSPSTVSLVRQTRFFIESNIGIQGVNPANGDNTNGLGIGFGPGVAHFITTNISLEALFKYNGVIGFGSSTTSSRLQLGLGFQIYLPGREVKATINQVR